MPWLLREEFDMLPSAPTIAEMRREMKALSKLRGDIMIGPWLSEVGFELLYFVPFLRWAVREFGLEPARLIAVSRGGVSSWYSGIADDYVDLFELYSTDEFRSVNEERWRAVGNQKQYDVSTFDQQILRLVRKRTGRKVQGMLHPSLMYRLLRFFWYEKAPVSLLHRHTVYERLTPPPLPTGRYGLPDRYTALRFYFRPSFPDTPENRRLIERVVASLAAKGPIVLLNPGLRIDDHEDAGVDARGSVYRIDHVLSAEDNLAVQTAVIANASTFIGTYGGLSYLGPYLGVPTVGIYSDAAELVPAHLDVTWRLSKRFGSPLTVLSSADSELLRSLLSQ